MILILLQIEMLFDIHKKERELTECKIRRDTNNSWKKHCSRPISSILLLLIPIKLFSLYVFCSPSLYLSCSVAVGFEENASAKQTASLVRFSLSRSAIASRVVGKCLAFTYKTEKEIISGVICCATFYVFRGAIVFKISA